MTARESVGRRLSMLALAAVVVMIVTAYVVYPFAIRAARADGREDMLPSAGWYAFPLVAVTFSAAAVVIHRRQPHLVGWLMHAVGLLLAAAQLGAAVYLLSALGRELGVAGRLLATWTGFAWAPALIVMTVLLPLTFPSGRPPTPRWWWVAGVGASALVFGFVVVTVDALTVPLDQVLENRSSWILSGLMVIGAAGALTSVVVRYRRAGGVERRQLTWVSSAFIAACSLIGASFTLPPEGVFTTAAGQLVLVAAMCLIPVSIGIAITRYRLYEIDRIISRTATYAVLTVLLAAVYAVVVFGVQQLMRPVIGRSDLTVAAATLTVAGLFGPARRRVQSGVDRRFNRARYDAERTIDTLRIRLRDEVDVDRLGAQLLATVRGAVHPVAVSLWLRSDGQRPARRPDHAGVDVRL